MLGEEYDSRLLGVKVCRRAEELLGEGFRAVQTDSPCPGLRAAHIYKEETEIFLLSNEGKENIRTRIFVPGGRQLTGYDLWKNRFYPIEAKEREEGAGLEIELMPCEMAAVICSCTKCLAEENAKARPDKAGPVETKQGNKAAGTVREELAGMVRTGCENWNGRFTQLSRKDNRAEYVYSFSAADKNEEGIFEVTGEEMAECYCNKKLAGVSFYSPHRFEIRDFLREGENEIRLVFTGNAANIYDKAGLFYGLGKPEGSLE